MTKIFFCVPAPPGISPGQRFRFEHYLDYLNEKGIPFKLSSFYSLSGWNTLYVKGKIVQKTAIVIRGFLKRIADLFQMLSCTHVYVYREVTPLGPPVFEWIIAKVLQKKIIYDFDDAIWIPVTAESNKIARGFKWFSKIGNICGWAHKVSVGNAFLAAFVKNNKENVQIIPTVVDTDNMHNQLKDQDSGSLTIGWTGTFSTLKYLGLILPVLQELQKTIDFTFLVIADKDPQLDLKNYRFIKWTRLNEIDDLLIMHIGLMPLFDTPIEKGKCGFKAIQYMALGIPAVVSPVGVNAEIVEDGVNGFVCQDKEQWKARLLELLKQPELRKKMGQAARQKIVSQYSAKATQQTFIDLFD